MSITGAIRKCSNCGEKIPKEAYRDLCLLCFDEFKGIVKEDFKVDLDEEKEKAIDQFLEDIL